MEDYMSFEYIWNKNFNLFVCFFFFAFFPDFSGRCGPEQMKGYVTKTEYEMLGEGAAKETPQNKFNRLQHEIRELAEELEQIKVSLCLWLRDLWLI